ncbi:hypothetical protein PSHT_11738, partial [Puccinia striiformis]
TGSTVAAFPEVIKAHRVNAKEIIAVVLSLHLHGWGEYLKCANSRMAEKKYHDNLRGGT